MRVRMHGDVRSQAPDAADQEQASTTNRPCRRSSSQPNTASVMRVMNA